MIRFLLSTLVLLAAAPLSAESKLYEILKDGVYEEFGSQLASLPGLKQLQELEQSKKFKLVTNAPQKGYLAYKANESHKSAWISLGGKGSVALVDGASMLPVGKYTVYVVPKNSKLKYHQKTVTIRNGKTQELMVDKFYSRNALFGLNITATPKNARIRVMNIKPKYRYGMKLPHRNDGYDIEISRRGYKTIREVVYLNSENQHFHYKLSRY